MQKTYRALALAAVAAALPAVVNAQAAPAIKPFRFGPQISLVTEGTTLGVGGRVEYSLSSMVPSLTDFRVVGSVDYFLIDKPAGATGASSIEIDVGVATSFSMPSAPVTPYAGAGLAMNRSSVSGGGTTVSGSETGLNIFGGVRFKPMGKLLPQVELRLPLYSGGDLIITGGVLF